MSSFEQKRPTSQIKLEVAVLSMAVLSGTLLCSDQTAGWWRLLGMGLVVVGLTMINLRVREALRAAESAGSSPDGAGEHRPANRP